MITPAQCRMARAALDITASQLAQLASVGANTILRYEAGIPVKSATAKTIQVAFENLGIVFIGRQRLSRRGGCGVRLATDG